ncbi:flagellin [Halobacteriovorax sp. HFRX-2_2]|uniref:flagellin n=1 Tax=unclassified Halobacteriovorax TaxID=2639665 RepID=UPI003723FB40
MRVGTNVTSQLAQRMLGEVNDHQTSEVRKLAGAKRIYQAAIDPAGAAISLKMTAQNRSNLQAQRNSNDSFSMLEVADATMGSMQDIAIRLKELSIQMATDTYNDSDRINTNREFKQLAREIIRIQENAEYNGTKLLNGGRDLEMQIGIRNSEKNDRIKYNISDVMTSNRKLLNQNVLTKEGARSAMGAADALIDKISHSRAKVGSTMKRVESTTVNLQHNYENSEAARSKIEDTDIAKATAAKALDSIKMESATAFLAQANTAPGAIAKLIG